MNGSSGSIMQETIDQLKNQIHKQIHHSFLKSVVDIPVLDDEKLIMLYHMFQESDCPSEQINTNIVSVMLVQAALDTHDSVSVGPLEDEKEKKSQQLTVLAGDYYSGLYYNLLANNKDVSFIRHLSVAIGIINEHKMYLYINENQTVEKAFENLRMVETFLLQYVAEYFQLPLWRSFFREYFFLRRLFTEKERYKRSQPSSVFTALINSKNKKDFFTFHQEKFTQLPQVLDLYIDYVDKSIESLFLKSSHFESLFADRLGISPFKPSLSKG